MKQPATHFRHSVVRKTYAQAAFLAVALFGFHTWVIFETAYLLSKETARVMAVLGVHLGGPVVILCSFFVLFVSHLLESLIWAVFFWKRHSFSTFGESLYFSGTSLTSLGYGDMVLHPPWRGLGPIMAINGILMFGCSTAFLFFVIQHIWSVF